jgi:Predicted NTPase (NACHT family)
MPESRHKYLYERLGDHDFQQLAGALLNLQFPDFVPLALRQADGGRDGVDRARQLIYQVKWSTTGQDRDPVAWLDAEIRGESAKIKTLASEGVRRYVLVTNVASTSKPKVGTFDKLNTKLDAYSEEYGLDMSCIWREALNSMVDAAPTEVKWAYADMLAGWDLIRYLVREQTSAVRDSALRDLLRRVAAAQWDDDARIKFSQVELDREYLADLFVDVPAERVRAPRRVASPGVGSQDLGGAAAYIAGKTPYPLTLVRGAPGQGKSTLSQFVCQAYRTAFLPNEVPPTSGLPPITVPRFPIRLDLADYAAWMQGYDVFDKSGDAEPKKSKRRAAAKSTIESYLAEMMTHVSGRDTITRDAVQDIFDRVPSLVVLDGLDEVGKVVDRKRVVHEINLFCARGKSYAVEPKVIVTTRPNSAGLPEPDAEIFETISLVPLNPALRDQYLRKWCVVHGVRGNDSRTLRRNFNEKMRETFIGELAGNPMQLTILLYLLKQHGDATPNQRTELYDAYMALLLAREANKHPESVRRHRDDLMEIVPFLGWYIQSRAEEDGHSGRMTRADVEAAMKHFQRTYGKPEEVVDELFEAATDRLWALTSKEEGTFEFEVLSLREYFAARFLYRYAGEGDPHFDRTMLFRELLRRPYWLNTVRFYSGNAVGSDIYILKAGIEHEVSSGTTKHVQVAAWSLLTDGVFNSRPQEAASIVDLLTDEKGEPTSIGRS